MFSVGLLAEKEMTEQPIIKDWQIREQNNQSRFVMLVNKKKVRRKNNMIVDVR